MNRIHTLFRTLLVAMPAAALVACGGGDNSDPTGGAEPQSADVPVAAAENAPADPVTLNADGVPVNELGTDMRAEGSEGEDPGFADAVASAPAGEPSAADDGVSQTSQALLGSRGAAVKSEAQRLVDMLNQSTSYYSHTTYMNESTGTFRTDCSGFTGYILSRVTRDGYDKVPKPSWRAKPLAEDYFAYIASRPTTASQQTSARWRRITSVKDLKVGDMVSWKYAPPNPNTGHLMIVRDVPRPGRSDRSEWIIPVIDATASPHAYKAWDSRGANNTGVGQGSIGLKIDSSGAPRAYYWTGGTSPTAVYTTVVMGRIE